ncbi:MAG: hypothetical protein P9M11_11130 [Candidatus Tenebribacter burtonii]|jgi:hypothetical protein|nr:hypothetical protein [Candidatus Tenebribacter burtonii]
MAEIRTKEFIKAVLTDKPARKELKKLGLTEEELDELMEAVVVHQKSNNYNRILGKEERRIITTDAFGYLIHLLKLGSVNKEIFEKVIVLSIQLNGFLKKKITRDMIDNIVNYIIFSGIEDVSVRDLLDLFFIQENEINFDEEIN